MDAILGFLSAKAVWILGGVGGMALIAIGRKVIPNLVGKYTGKLVQKALSPETDDPKLKQLTQDFALASVRLAEYLIPDSGMGQSRKEMVSKVLQRIFPKGQADSISDIIEAAVIKADEELKRASSERR